MAGGVAKQILRLWFVDVGKVVVQGILVGNQSLVVVGSLAVAVSNLPGLLVVVRGRRSQRPHVAVAGNLAGIIEVVEHAELQGELMLIGCDVLAVENERGIAVADFEIAKNLIVGAILFHDVDGVADGIVA